MANSQQYPEPSSGQPKQGGGGYPEPSQHNPINTGLQATSHNGSNYPQPNSPNRPDSSSQAPAAPVPGVEVYRPSLAGNTLGQSEGNPGVVHGNEPPDYPK